MRIDFVGHRRLWYILSAVIILAGVISLAVQGLNLGIDFTAGNILQVGYEQSVEVAKVREAMGSMNLGDRVQSAEGNQFIIRTPEMSEEQGDELLAKLGKLGNMQVLRNEKVLAIVGKELTMKAYYSLAVAAVLMLIYIAFRFEVRFGLAAVVALLHDVLVTLGIFSILQIEVDSTFVAAVLTLIGYSINDTIVVFDRIRENLHLGKKREQAAELVNRSINQTLFRSISTSMAVIMVLLALIFLGGPTTRVFSIAMLIGTITGTYSSICVASPLWLDLRGVRQNGRH